MCADAVRTLCAVWAATCAATESARTNNKLLYMKTCRTKFGG